MMSCMEILCYVMYSITHVLGPLGLGPKRWPLLRRHEAWHGPEMANAKGYEPTRRAMPNGQNQTKGHTSYNNIML